MATDQILSLPAASAGLTPISSATAWLYGSWVEASASLSTDIYVLGLAFQNTDASPGAGATREYLFEIGIGAIGSEVTKIQIPYSNRAESTAYGYYRDTLKAFLPEPYLIPAGTRIAVRVTDSIALAITYSGVKIMCREAAPPPPQTISNAGNIASLEGFGMAMVALGILASGILSGEAFGSATVVPGPVTITPSAIVSQETWGTPNLQLFITPSGIASEEAFGTAIVSGAAPPQTISDAGNIASEEGFGQAQLNLNIAPAGIVSGENFGTASVQPGPVTVLPDGIVSSEAFGSPTLAFVVAPTGITSAEQFGSPTLALTINPTGIATAEIFGAPILVLVIEPSGIASAEAFGSPTVLPGAVTVNPSGIGTQEDFGQATVTLAGGAIILSPSGIPSAEAFGQPTIVIFIRPVGIASEETLGNPIILAGEVSLLPQAIPPEEAFGNPSLLMIQFVGPPGIESLESFGTPEISKEEIIWVWDWEHWR